MPQATWRQLSSSWKGNHAFPLGLCDASGAWLIEPGKACVHGGPSAEYRRRALSESLRWGEPFIHRCCSESCLLFAVPLMLNERLTGGILVSGVPLDAAERPDGGELDPVSRAVRDLLQFALRENLTNASRLHLAREAARRERERAEAIHAVKEVPYDGLRSIYLREEGELHAAVKRSDRKEARSVINRILIAVYSFGEHRLDFLKSLLLEMVVMVGRTAVDAGANPAALLSAQVPAFRALSDLEDEEELAGWVSAILEQMLDAMRDAPGDPDEDLAAKAVAYMERHLDQDLSRDEVAERAGVSPSHFSRLMHRKTGRTFSETLTHLRVRRARELLVRTRIPLSEVASDCGFADQSHFTKVFNRTVGLSPGEYRRHRGERIEGGPGEHAGNNFRHPGTNSGAEERP
ncbi:MAG: helix-turn-helix domain-containing protein [Spirochaetes bacterium]|nr:helix-turn-helix domain-containing protein [Spirochaetota bacterium]